MRNSILAAGTLSVLGACSDNRLGLKEYDYAPDVDSAACMYTHLNSPYALEEGAASEDLGLYVIGTQQDDTNTQVLGVYNGKTGDPVAERDLDYWVEHQIVPVAYPSSYENFDKAANDGAIIDAKVVGFGNYAPDTIEVGFGSGVALNFGVFVDECTKWAPINGELEHEVPAVE